MLKPSNIFTDMVQIAFSYSVNITIVIRKSLGPKASNYVCIVLSETLYLKCYSSDTKYLVTKIMEPSLNSQMNNDILTPFRNGIT